MQKKLLAILMISLSIVTSFVACGAGKENSTEVEAVQAVGQTNGQLADDENDAATDISAEVIATAGQSVTGEGVQVEGPDDGDVVISVEGEVTEITDGEVTEIIDGEVTEIIDGEIVEIVEVEGTTDAVPDDGTDWSVKYDNYFTRDNIMPEKLKVMVTADTDGVVYEMSAAMVNESVFMSYDFGTVALDMYVMADKAYVCTKMEGQEVWNFASISPEEADDMTVGVEDNTALINSEHIGSVTYREALEEDGVIYDVLDVIMEDGYEVPGTAVYFINRETQQVAKCVIEQQGNTTVCLVEEIESIELPAEAETATEVTMEDILGALLGVMLMGSGAVAE